VIDGVNGYLIEPNHIDEYTKKIVALLQDPAMLDQYSRRAIEKAKRHCSIEVVTGKWRRNLRDVVSQASGHCVQEVMN
jgi:glycosyltransferase involved in cell wall biosynthesis